LSYASRDVLGLLTEWVSGTISWKIERPGRGVDNSYELKNAWSYTSTTTYSFKAYRETTIFYFVFA
jgi:hypothetical protein